MQCANAMLMSLSFSQRLFQKKRHTGKVRLLAILLKVQSAK